MKAVSEQFAEAVLDSFARDGVAFLQTVYKDPRPDYRSLSGSDQTVAGADHCLGGIEVNEVFLNKSLLFGVAGMAATWHASRFPPATLASPSCPAFGPLRRPRGKALGSSAASK